MAGAGAGAGPGAGAGACAVVIWLHTRNARASMALKYAQASCEITKARCASQVVKSIRV